MWAAYFQADGEIRHTIAVKKFRGAAEQAAADFVARMSNPEVGVWFTWVEETDGKSADTCEVSEVRT